MRATTATFGVILVLAALPRPAKVYARANSISPRLHESTIQQREDPTTQHSIVVGLDLRNRDELETLLADIQDPHSPNYRRFLTPEEFNSRYAPSTDAEQRVVDHLHASGLRVTQRFRNRLLVSAAGSVAVLEHAFGVEMHRVSFGGESHYASVNEPSFPEEVAPHVIGVIGLDDLVTMRPHVRAIQFAASPRAAIDDSYSLSPADLQRFYDNDGTYNGAGQTVVIAGVYAWYDADVAEFNTWWGLPSLPAGSGQICTGTGTPAGCRINFNERTNPSIEVTLDVEYTHGTAPGATILNYMAASTGNAAFATLYNAIVNDNPGHVVTTSWGSCEAENSLATQQVDDSIFANANAIGQSWFAASGDNGSRDCTDNNRLVSVDHPANSPHVIGVGGTSPVCSSGMTSTNPACAGYGSESGWGDSGGGISQVFDRPSFQTGCGVPAGSQRLVPDVAIEADPSPGNFVLENDQWYIVGGTSDGAPQWAGIFSSLSQKLGGIALGNPGAGLYGLCGTDAFHDITVGSNGDYNATTNYDMVTGLGSPDIAHLLASSATCGNGVVELGEQCDDDNTTSGDGCSATCQIETGWTCTGEPSACTLAACPAHASGAPSCACDTGYTGTLTWNGSGWTGSCTPPPNVDAVVLPPKPVSITIPSASTQVTKALVVRVRNADTSDRTIRLDVDATPCPPGSVGVPDFGNGQNSVLVKARNTRRASVPLTIRSGDFTSFNFKAPRRCTVVLTASAVVAGGSNDPNPSNNQATVEINVVNRNDPEQTDRHETTINSAAPAKVTIARGAAIGTKELTAVVGNADYRPTVEKPGDPITLQASTSCSGLTLTTPVCDPITGSDTVAVNGGATKACKLVATVDPTQISTPNRLSPQRCTATLTAIGPSYAEASPLDPSNDTTQLTVDITDNNDF